MVRGLIEDEQFGLGDERPGQCDTLGLPARKRRRVGIEQTTHAEPVEYRFGLPRRRVLQTLR